MRNALNGLVDTVKDASEKKVSGHPFEGSRGIEADTWLAEV